MTLISNFFRGDKKLEACQIDDRAHLTLGVKGDHVTKVQMALHALDRLTIAAQEQRSQTYGPSTAQAVLKFKTKRKIINPAYQQTPDNIVGKMTISRLDQEMREFEISHKASGDCTRSPPGTPASLSPVARSGLVSLPTTGRLAAKSGGQDSGGKLPQLGRALRIYCSITRKASIEDGYPIARHIEKAKDCLFEHGMTLSVEFRTGFADTINFPGSLVLDEDVALLRQASEDARPGFPSILRIIVCPRSPNAPPGETFRNISVGDKRFPPFAVLNSSAVAGDNVMLHEMIHAAYPGPKQHDAEDNSVFFEFSQFKPGEVDQRLLKPEHALTLSKSFFAI